MPLRLERRYRFSTAHLYRRPEWSEEENLRRFGKCSYEPGHGHNYRLWVMVAGEVDPATGFLVDLGELDALVHRRVVEVLDHRHVNHAVAEFAVGPVAEGTRVPTGENLVGWVRGRLEGEMPAGVRLVGLRLAEDDDLACTWWAEGHGWG